MASIEIKYVFTLPDGKKETFILNLDPQSLELAGNKPSQIPAWTKLEFHQCMHCPLNPSEFPQCPLAINLVNIVQPFEEILSCDNIRLDVITTERKISQMTTAQKGISALMGLIIPSSGCPHTTFFRPMARYHLPLANREETIYRATSMYLLAQYFLNKDNKPIDIELKGLVQIYKNMELVNITMAERLRAISETDSTINALVLLDTYTKTIPRAIKDSLEQLRYLFTPFFEYMKE